MEDSVDRFYKALNRFVLYRLLASLSFRAVTTIVMGLFALLVTLSAILESLPALTRGTLIFIAVVLWLFTLVWLNWWMKWKVVAAWKQERQELTRKIEHVNAYFAKVDAGELPNGPTPADILQDLRDIRADWRRELLRQEFSE